MKTIQAMHPAPDMNRRNLTLGLLACGLSLPMFAPLATAQPATAAATFPDKAIRLVLPFPPAGAVDHIGRLYSKALLDSTGQPIVVENRPGANGLIGVRDVLRSSRDGYSVLIGSSSTMAFNAALFKELPYDPRTDFIPVGILATLPAVLITNVGSRFRTFDDLIQTAKKHPKEINYGTGSTSMQLSAAWMNDLAGIDTTGIAFKGASEVVNALLSNSIDVGLVDLSAASELIRSGKLRGLALAATERYASLPDVPTTAEVGLKEYSGEMWVLAAVAAGTPDDIVTYYAEAFAKAAQQPEIQTWLRQRDMGYTYHTVTEMQSMLAAEIDRWQGLVERLNVPRL